MARSRSNTTSRTTDYVTIGESQVRVIRSSRRTRTVEGGWHDGMIQISVPMRLPHEEMMESVERLVTRIQRKRTARHDTDTALLDRARQLAATWLSSSVEPSEVVWSTRQMKRWGSCTPTTGRIRLSAQLKPMPQWVQDGVLVHELAHLKYSNHGADFRALAHRYPRQQEAQAFLAGVTFATTRALETRPEETDDDMGID